MARYGADDETKRGPEVHPLRAAREAMRLSRADLAQTAGISRQALAAIEGGRYQPGVAVALKIAREVGQSVEALFGGRNLEQVEAEVAPRASAQVKAGSRVALARVGRRVVAVQIPAAALKLGLAGGVVESRRGRRAEVEAFRTPREIDSTLLIAGCDPGAAVLAEWLARRHAPFSLIAIPSSSAAALTALATGQAHAAGIHLRDSSSGEYNLAAARAALSGRRAVLVNFARWEMGIAAAPGNPKNIAAIADFARADVRIVNRERGAGARAVLDDGLKESGIAPAQVAGYERELAGHLEVAAAIAAGAGDTGITLRVAANAYGLSFVVLCEERYDLVITEASKPVTAMLDALASSRFARELAATCAYDTRQTGQTVGQVG